MVRWMTQTKLYHTLSLFSAHCPRHLSPVSGLGQPINHSPLSSWLMNCMHHTDLNFMTIHGRSRFPGLFIWTRDGTKRMVKVPEGCLLVQAGKQFEYLTAGEVLAGFHEVVVVEETQAAIERARAAERSLWRISSTVFGHIASDQSIAPLEKFATGTQAWRAVTGGGSQYARGPFWTVAAAHFLLVCVLFKPFCPQPTQRPLRSTNRCWRASRSSAS